MTGIYLITNSIDNKYYVGKSINIENRWKTHISKLNMNKHDNLDLQKDWNKLGEDKFTFKLLEVCSKDILTNRENHWIDIFNAKELGYNFNNRKTNTSSWNKDTKRDLKIKKLMELCLFYSDDNSIGCFFFDDICEYLNMNYSQLVKFLLDMKNSDFKKYNMYVQRNWDSCYEYVSFCKWDTECGNDMCTYEIDDIQNFIDNKMPAA